MTNDFLREKSAFGFLEPDVYIFKNVHTHMIKYYAVMKPEFDNLCKSVSPEILPETYITVYELDLIDDVVIIKYDGFANMVSLGKRKIKDMVQLKIENGYFIL